MRQQPAPETFYLDVTGANGTPLRFVLTPSAKPYRNEDDPDAPMVGKVMYYDRRYPSAPGAPEYRAGSQDENGQNCGPAMYAEQFAVPRGSGMRGWHDVRAWDVDGASMYLVGRWVVHTMNAYAAARGLRWQTEDEADSCILRALVPANTPREKP